MLCQFVYCLNSQITIAMVGKGIRMFPIVIVKQWHPNNGSLMLSLKKKKNPTDHPFMHYFWNYFLFIFIPHSNLAVMYYS